MFLKNTANSKPETNENSAWRILVEFVGYIYSILLQFV